MAFGISLDVKLEAPKLEVPKLDVGTSPANATTAGGTIASAAGSATGTVTGATEMPSPAPSPAGGPAETDDMAKPAVDLVLEPHLVLTANANFAETEFKNGPIWIRVDLTPDEAKASTDTLRLFSESGAYDEKCRVSDFTDANEATVDVLFADAPMNGEERYTLEVISENEESHTVFEHVVYSAFRK